MKKCRNCGNVVEDDISICDQCGYDLDIKIKPVKKEKRKLEPQTETDLFDYPILAFIFGIASLIIPIYLFSILAIILSKKPYKKSLEPMSRLGSIFGCFGILISTIFFGYLLYNLVF